VCLVTVHILLRIKIIIIAILANMHHLYIIIFFVSRSSSLEIYYHILEVEFS
jgi:hypothetical protein